MNKKRALILSGVAVSIVAVTVSVLSWRYLQAKRQAHERAMAKVEDYRARAESMVSLHSRCERMQEEGDPMTHMLRLAKLWPGNGNERAFQEEFNYVSTHFETGVLSDVCDDGKISSGTLESAKRTQAEYVRQLEECRTNALSFLAESTKIHDDVEVAADPEAAAMLNLLFSQQAEKVGAR